MMKKQLLLLLFAFLVLFLHAQQLEDPSMDPEEAAAVFDVLYAINAEIDWRALFPGDNPCTGGPHGLNCDIVDSSTSDSLRLHVVELNLGWVSDFVNNPPCAANATIHPSIRKLRYLRKLFFYQCFYGSPMRIPSEISALGPSLRHLTFQDNVALVGPIPAQLSNLTSLERLVLTENRLEGAIPEQLGSLLGLQQLVLSHNRLSGSIPASLADCSSLRILDLSGNRLGGPIPASFGPGLASIEKMDLSGNDLRGGFPLQLGSRLRFLDLSWNNLSGGVPDGALLNLTSLQALFVRGNSFLGGSIPASISELRSLEMVSFSDTGMDGTIPESIGELERLNSLALDGNSLSGTIPASIATLGSLYHLNLSSNRLSGPIPFPQEFLSRLGRNLVVRDNSGLCHEMELGQELVQFLGLQQCSSNAFGDFPGTARHSAAAAAISSATSLTFIDMFFLSITIVLLQALRS